MMDLDRAKELRRVKRALDLLDSGQASQARDLLTAWYRGICERLAHRYGDSILATAEADVAVELPPARAWLPSCRP